MRLLHAIAAMLILAPTLAAQVLPYRLLDEPLPVTATSPQGAADFDLDGNVDLLTSIGILVGDGHANFSVAAGAPLSFARAVTRVADLNADGLPDVASVTPLGVGRVELNGGGFFFAQVPAPIPALPPAGPYGVPAEISRYTPGDVDGDGDMDLVAQVKVLGIHNYQSSSPILLLNNGSATFTVAPATVFPATTLIARQVDLADVDGDGDLDVLITGTPTGLGGYDRLFVLTNSGTIFSPPVQVFTGNTSLYPGVGDFNGDGIADVALQTFVGAVPSATVLFGSATGLVPGVNSPLPFAAIRMIAIDVNADGRDEILAGPYWAGWSVSAAVFPVSATGVVGAPTQTLPGVQLALDSPPPDVVTDFDQDGDRDLVATVGTRPVLLMNAGVGALVLVGTRLANYSIPGVAKVGDVDADGDLDILGWGASSTGATIEASLNDGDGFFSPGSVSPLPAVTSNYLLLHAFDRDGDGDVDLYAARNMYSVTATAGTDLVLDNAGGVFSVAFTLADYGPVVAIRDLDVDGDGDRDIVLGRRWPTTTTGPLTPMLLVKNLGAGGFAAAVPIGPGHYTYDLEIADFDGNGTPDIFQTNRNFNAPTVIDSCELYLNSGGGTFTSIPQPAMTGYYSAAGDVDGNGLPDVVLDSQVWLNNGAGTFVAGSTIAPAVGTPISLADIDEDGDLDLVESPAGVRLNGGTGTFGPLLSQLTMYPWAPTSWIVPTSVVADFDRDGGPDVLGSDGRMHMNCSRQIALGRRARPGRPGSLDMWGSPGAIFALFVSGTPANFVHPFGNVLIDPATAILLHAGIFAPIGSATPGFASIQGTIPAVPALAGVTLYWQMVDQSLRLSNRMKTTIAGY